MCKKRFSNKRKSQKVNTFRGPAAKRVKRESRKRNKPVPAMPPISINSQGENASEPMDYDEKYQLFKNIAQMPGKRPFHIYFICGFVIQIYTNAVFDIFSGNKLGQIVRIVQTHESSHIDSYPEQIDIDFNALKASTLRELQSFVMKSINEQKIITNQNKCMNCAERRNGN